MRFDARLNSGPMIHARARARMVGTLLVYGEKAGDRPEVFAPDSLTFAMVGWFLNRQHERRSPIMRFTPEVRGRELVIDAKLPNTAAGRDAAAEVQKRACCADCRSSSSQHDKSFAAGFGRSSRASFAGPGWSIAPIVLGFVGCGSSARRAG